MEIGLNMLHRLTPVGINGKDIILSDPEGDLFLCNLLQPNLRRAPFDLYLHCQLFTLTQQDTGEKPITRLRLADKWLVPEEISAAVENFSVSFRDGNVSLSLFLAEDHVPVSYLISGNGPPLEAALRPGRVYFGDEAVLEIDNLLLRWGRDKNEQICHFSSLLSLSQHGVLLSVETPGGMSICWYSPTITELQTLTPENDIMLQAVFDDSSDDIVFTRAVAGQQSLCRYDRVTGELQLEHESLYGTVTPLLAAGTLFLYITGTQEGIYVQNNTTGDCYPLVPGQPSVSRRYHEHHGIKVTSIIGCNNPKLDVLMFHGGPESCEWDTPRLPNLIRELTTAQVNFHIVNYAGSSGFGQAYRSMVDKQVLAGAITPVRQWLQHYLPGARLVLTGGSFGGTLALELLAAEPVPGVEICGIIVVNPLLDLHTHLARVRRYNGDMAFFERKFSAEDITYITPQRYADTLRAAEVPALFILGRHDEVLDVRPALSLVKNLRDRRYIKFFVDDGTHAPLSHTVHREQQQKAFIHSLLGDYGPKAGIESSK